MRIGFLVCAGGSAFANAVSAFDVNERSRIHVVTDRECGAEARADDLGLSKSRIGGVDRAERSTAILEAFRASGVSACIALYDRLITHVLYDAIPCINIHPSLLPAHPGMGSVKRSFDARDRFIGATAHLIDAGVDTGPILVQIKALMPRTLDEAEHMSFTQKAVLARAACQMLLEDDAKATKEWILERFLRPSPADV